MLREGQGSHSYPDGSSYDGEGMFALWRIRSEIARAAAVVSSLFLSATGLGRPFSFVAVQPSGAQLAEVFSLIGEGHLRVFVERVFGLVEIREAHAQLARNHTRGKLVLRVAGR